MAQVAQATSRYICVYACLGARASAGVGGCPPLGWTPTLPRDTAHRTTTRCTPQRPHSKTSARTGMGSNQRGGNLCVCACTCVYMPVRCVGVALRLSVVARTWDLQLQWSAVRRYCVRLLPSALISRSYSHLPLADEADGAADAPLGSGQRRETRAGGCHSAPQSCTAAREQGEGGEEAKWPTRHAGMCIWVYVCSRSYSARGYA